jgi:hypothetical protein
VNPEVKQKWVAALKSGEFEQGRHCLTDLTAPEQPLHCCLGVLCELAVKDGVPVQVVNSKRQRYYDSAGSVLPPVVREWAGLDRLDPAAGDIALSSLNDNGWGFNEIANRIEAYL